MKDNNYEHKTYSTFIHSPQLTSFTSCSQNASKAENQIRTQCQIHQSMTERLLLHIVTIITILVLNEKLVVH